MPRTRTPKVRATVARAEVPEGPAAPAGRRGRAAAAGLALAWALLIGGVCVQKYRFFLYADFDLAIFAQALEQLMHGRGFVSIRGMNWLGDHSSLILLGLAPLWVVVRHPLLLPVAQAAALASGAISVHAYARRRLGEGGAAVALAAAWLLQPALAYVALFEFHPEALATPALLACGVALAARRRGACLSWAAVAALAKEDVALVLLALALVAPRIAPGSRARFALPLAGIGLASLALTFGVLKPTLSSGEATYGAMYAAWGSTPLEVARTVVTHPGRALGALIDSPGDPADALARRQYWLHLLGPTLGLVLLGPLWLVPALPAWAEHFLSFRIEQHTIVFQYGALVLPFVMLAAVDGLARARGFFARVPSPRASRIARAGGLALVAGGIAAHALWGPFAASSPLRAQEPTEAWWPSARDRRMAPERRALMARLPARGAIVSDFLSLPGLARRDSVHSLHHVLMGSYTFSSRPYPPPRDVTALIADVAHPSLTGYLDEGAAARLAAFAGANRLRIVARRGDLLLLEPAPAESTAWLEAVAPVAAPEPYTMGLQFEGAELDRAPRPAGGAVELVTHWRRVAPLADLAFVQLRLLDPAGRARLDQLRMLGYGLSPPSGWPLGVPLAERYALLLPGDLPPGPYRLEMTLGRRSGPNLWEAEPVSPALRGAEGRIPLGTVLIER
jgi:uncharacterized membrane protein